MAVWSFEPTVFLADPANLTGDDALTSQRCGQIPAQSLTNFPPPPNTWTKADRLTPTPIIYHAFTEESTMNNTFSSLAPKSRLLLLLLPAILLLGAANLAAAAPAFAADTLVVTSAATATAPSEGSTIAVTVTAQNATPATDTGFGDTIKLTTSQSKDVVSPATEPAVKGVANFTVNLKGSSGSETLTAVDTKSGGASSNTVPITPTPGPAVKLAVTSSPATTATDGTSPTVTVTAYDAYGNVATGYRGKIALSSGHSSSNHYDVWTTTHTGTFIAPVYANSTYTPGNYQFIAGDNGVATFAVALNGVGSDTITAAPFTTGTGVTSGTETLTVTPSAAATLGAVITTTAPTTNPKTCGAGGTSQCWINGETVSVAVTAYDGQSNVDPAYTSNVTLTPTDAADVVTYPAKGASSYTFTSGDKGAHTFTVQLKGCQSTTAPVLYCTDGIALADTSATPLSTNAGTLSSPAIYVIPGAVTQLNVAAATSSVAAGSTDSLTVTPANTYGQEVDATFADTEHVTSTDPVAVMPADQSGDYTSTSPYTAPTLTVTLQSQGKQTVTVADTTLASKITGSTTVTVTPDPADHMVVSTSADGAINGSSVNVTVTTVDANGFPTAGTGTVTLSDSDTTDKVTANGYPFPTSNTGTHTFAVQLLGCDGSSGPCTDTITATDAALTGTSNTPVVTVTPGVVTKLLVAPASPGTLSSTARRPGST